MKIKEWFQMMTLGQPYKYLRLMLWCLFDSIVMSIPYGLMLGRSTICWPPWPSRGRLFRQPPSGFWWEVSWPS